MSIVDEGRTVLCARIVRKGWNVELDGKENAHIKMLIPRGREGTLDCSRGICLITIDRDDGKGLWETEDFTFDEGVGGKN